MKLWSVVVVLTLCGCTKQASRGVGGIEANGEQQVAGDVVAGDLSAIRNEYYNGNIAAADAKYLNKRFVLTATVQKMEKGKDSYVLFMYPASNPDALIGVVHFDLDQVNALANVKLGKPLTFEATVKGPLKHRNVYGAEDTTVSLVKAVVR